TGGGVFVSAGVTATDGGTAIGNNSVSASSGGTASFPDLAANSAGFGAFITNLPAGQTVTDLTISPSSPSYGQTVTIKAGVLANSGTPTGTVTFYRNGVSLGPATVDASGAASISTNTLTGGSQNLSAAYSGDSSFSVSSSPALTVTVATAPT